jgi:hypothetical protein
MRPAFANSIRLALLLAMACAGINGLGQSTDAGVPPQPFKLVPSPVRVLRELLSLPSAEREEMLALYPTGLREPLETKVKEYRAMPADQRELRLQATDLRHYLMQMLPLDAATRATALEQVPEPIRQVVADRLETWQLLLPEMQQDFLENEQVVRYFTQIGITDEEQRKGLLDVTPPDARARIDAKIAGWQALPEETRRRVFAQFNQMFDLTAEEQHKALSTLSDEEREAIGNTLNVFRSLPPEQRRVCMRSFEKFSRMSLLERREFLQKAKAWERMTLAEREQWREVVNRVKELPPLPPDLMLKIDVPASAPATNGG